MLLAKAVVMELTLEIIGFLIAVAFIAGAIDAIAGGGGLLTLPALLAAGASPAAAIGTNKLPSTFGVATAVFTFARNGRIDFKRFAGPAIAAFLGSAAGAFVLSRIDPTILSGLIPILLVVMAIYYTVKRDLSDEDGQRARPIMLLAVALAIGFYDGFFGPGAGSFYTTALIAMFGFGTINAIALTKLLNFSSNLAGLMVLMAAGEVLLLVGGLVDGAASMAGAYLGAHSTMRFGTRAVRPLLIIMCLALTARLLSDPENPLTTYVLGLLG